MVLNMEGGLSEDEDPVALHSSSGTDTTQNLFGEIVDERTVTDSHFGGKGQKQTQNVSFCASPIPDFSPSIV